LSHVHVPKFYLVFLKLSKAASQTSFYIEKSLFPAAYRSVFCIKMNYENILTIVLKISIKLVEKFFCDTKTFRGITNLIIFKNALPRVKQSNLSKLLIPCQLSHIGCRRIHISSEIVMSIYEG